MRGALDFNALSDDQREVFEKVMAWYEGGADRVLTLGGYAGTGKSTLVSVLAKELERAGSGPDHHFNIAFCAYTGKAANVLKQKLRQAGIPLFSRPGAFTFRRSRHRSARLATLTATDAGEVVAHAGPRPPTRPMHQP